MAYAGAITVSDPKVISGRRHYTVTIAETEGGTGEEWGPVNGLPVRYTVVRYRVHKASGSATQFTPTIGNGATQTASNANEGATYTAAAFIMRLKYGLTRLIDLRIFLPR